MKKLIFSLVIAALAFQSCDYVEVPQQSVQGPTPGDSDEVVRKVLLEDYTGHTCGNCPEAAIVAQNAINTYGEQVVVLSVHAGFFAEPSSAPYAADYRTATGDTYDAFFGISAVGNPNGMVNRMDYATSSHIKGHGSWLTLIGGIVTQAPDIDISITNTYDNITKQLSTSVETEFLNTMSGTYKLVVLLAEDSIVSAQKDYSQSPSNVLNYVHRHMLRDAVNSTWGDQVGTGTISAGTIDSQNYVYNGLTANPTWNPDHCYVVAYVYDAATYEVIQVEEKKVK